jgi:hypothetical protein
MMAHANLIPAMAVLITKVAVGLRNGKNLSKIKMLSHGYTVPPATYVLERNSLGLSSLTYGETEKITGLDLAEYETSATGKENTGR